MFHFMEFVDRSEGRSHRSMLEFWMCANNFTRRSKTSKSSVDKTSQQNDAIHIYEKYISMQASSALGFGSDIRLTSFSSLPFLSTFFLSLSSPNRMEPNSQWTHLGDSRVIAKPVNIRKWWKWPIVKSFVVKDPLCHCYKMERNQL